MPSLLLTTENTGDSTERIEGSFIWTKLFTTFQKFWFSFGVMKRFVLLLLPFGLLACKKEKHEINVAITCDVTSGDSCYYNGGVQKQNSSETDRVEGMFNGSYERTFKAADGDLFFFTVYNPNQDDLPYEIKAYFDGELKWECADSVQHKDNDGNKNACNTWITVGE